MRDPAAGAVVLDPDPGRVFDYATKVNLGEFYGHPASEVQVPLWRVRKSGIRVCWTKCWTFRWTNLGGERPSGSTGMPAKSLSLRDFTKSGAGEGKPPLLPLGIDITADSSASLRHFVARFVVFR